MSSGGRVRWKGVEAGLLVGKATDAMLNKLAAACAGHAMQNIQANGQIDTGFMINSVFMVGPEGDTYARARLRALARADRELGRKPKRPEGTALVAVGAEYAIYQENMQPFLFPALEQTRGDLREAARAGKRRMK